jgi:hypothetical protein
VEETLANHLDKHVKSRLEHSIADWTMRAWRSESEEKSATDLNKAPVAVGEGLAEVDRCLTEDA